MPVETPAVTLMVSKSYPDSEALLQEFNEALQRIKTKGIDRQILKKYRLELDSQP